MNNETNQLEYCDTNYGKKKKYVAGKTTTNGHEDTIWIIDINNKKEPIKERKFYFTTVLTLWQKLLDWIGRR